MQGKKLKFRHINAKAQSLCQFFCIQVNRAEVLHYA